MKPKQPFLLILILSLSSFAGAQNINLFAGNYSYGYSGNGGPATQAQLAWPNAVASDKKGNIYITDFDNNVIRIVDTSGIINLFAGNHSQGYSGDSGLATSAQLLHPSVITLDSAGNVYFADQDGDVIRKIDTAGIITTITGNLPTGYSGDGGPLIQAQFHSITGLTFDKKRNLYIADFGNNVIRKVDTSGIVTTIAGNGTAGFGGDGGQAVAAQLNRPYAVVIDTAGNIYIPDNANHRIRKIDTSGIITTYAGNGVAGYSGDGGPAINASLNFPWFSTIDKAGNIYVVDALNYVVRRIDPTGSISTYAGTGMEGCSGDGGPAINATMDDLSGIAVDSSNNVYIVNRTPCYTIRKVNACSFAFINQQPVTVSICKGSDTSFRVNATNAIAYQWEVNTGSGWNNISDNTIYTGSDTNILHILDADTGMNGHQYRCAIMDSCRTIYSSIATLTVKVTATPTITLNGNTLTSSSSTGNQWFLNGTIISGATNQQYTATASGNYTVQTTQNGCVSVMSAAVNITITAVTDPQLDNEMVLFPNPAHDKLYIKNSRLRNVEITIYDLYGKRILQTISRSQVIELSTNNAAAGFYLITIKDILNNKITTKRLIKI